MQNKLRIYILSLLLITGLSFFQQEVKAVTAYPNQIVFSQPDGTTINIFLKGDEKIKWALTTDGYTIMFNSQGIYEYATLNSNSEMVPSGIKANDIANRNATELNFLSQTSQGIFYSKSQIGYLKQIWEIYDAEAKSNGPKAFPTTGNRKLICILMNFTDKTFTYSKAEFTNLFNQVGYANLGALGSIKDFFLENSYNQLNLTVDVFGPYTAANNMAYYGANDVNGDDVNARALITEAVNAANPLANYVDYDNDGDGTVDGVYVIYAGNGEADGGAANTIWPHAWNIVPVVLDGKTVSRYSCSNEQRSGGTNITRIGVICHEFGHVLGAPDFYDTDYATGGSYTGTGNWDLQAGGSYNGPAGDGARPAHSNPYTKAYIYNWTTPILLTTQTSVSLPNSTTNNAFYRYNTTTANEYYLIENRQQTGFNTNVPYHGMLIYHVDANYIAAHRSNLNAGSHQGCYPVCAGATGNPPTVYGTIDGATCPFPGTGAKTTFTDATTPNSKSWAGANTGKPIISIAEAGGNITFCFITCPTANDPTAFSASPLSTSQINLAWTKNVSANPVMVAYNTTPTFGTPVNGTAYIAGNTIAGGGTVIYNGALTTYNHTGLNPGTTYYYKAWSVVPTNTYSTGVTNNATTLCGQITTFPWNEGFENGGNIPNCWSQQYVADAWNWSFRAGSASATPTTAHGGSYNANLWESATAGTTYETKLITPSMVLGSYSTATLRFWHYQAVNTAAQDILNIYYKTSATGPWMYLTTYSAAVAAWTQQTVVLPNLSNDYYVAFDGTEYGGKGICIDDVQVTITPVTTPPVSNFTASSLTPSVGETVTFTDLSSNAPTSWAWSFSPATVTYVDATTASSQNPHVQFNSVGAYNVTLTATNGFGSNPVTKTAYINICSLGDIQTTGVWTEQATAFPTASRYPSYISIVDANVVWATGGDGSGGGASVREFTKTVNGGATWTYGGTFNGIVAGMTDATMIFGIDANTAYATFYDGATPLTVPVVGKTTNGGANWTASCTFANNTTSFPNVVHFFDANNGFCMGDPAQTTTLDMEIYTTNNAGGTWTRVPAANIPDAVTGEYGIVGLYDAVGNTAWFTTNNGYLYKTINNGLNWTKHQIINTVLTTNIIIEMSNANIGIVQVNLSDASSNSAGTVYYRTSDGGVTWTPLARSGLTYDGDIAYVPGTCDSYVNTGSDWSITNGMGVSYSIDGGTTYANLNAPQVNGANVQMGKVEFLNTSTGWAGGYTTSATVGGIYKYSVPVVPVADFIADVTIVPVGGTVNFTDLSTGTPSSWSWTFNGGTPVSSTVQNPAVIYNTAGTYDVTLTVTNVAGTNSLTKTGYIVVVPVIVTWHFPNTTDDAIADGGITPNLAKTISVAGGVTAPTFATAGATTRCASATQWGTGSGTKYWLVDFVTTGYQSLKVSSKMTGNTTAAPRDFKLQYSLNGTTWTDVTGATITLAANSWTTSSANISNIALPVACENQAQVFLRWIMTSNTSIAGGAITGARAVYIDDILVTGLPLSLTPPVADFTATPTSVCVGQTVTFTDVSTNSPTSWAWTFTGGTPSTSTAQNPTVTFAAAGTYNVSLTATNAGGNNTMTKTNYITVNALPTAAITPATATICAGASSTLTASGGTSYLWSNAATSAAITVTPATTTTYTVTVTNAATCTAIASRIVTVNALPTAAITPASATICSGASSTLTASGGTSYLWSNAATTAAITVTPAATTTYTVTVTNAATCTAISSATVTVNASPTAAITPATSTICAGASSTLTASGGTSYLWSNAATTAAITVTPAATTTYTVTVTNAAGCTAVTSRIVTVNALPTAAITPATATICAGQSSTLTASGGTSYLWSNAATSAAITVTPAATTTYTVTVTNAATCTAIASRIVTVNALPTAAITPASATICTGASSTLTASGGTSYLWSNAATTAAITVTPAATTTYTVTVTNAAACSAISSATVTVNAAPTAAITPASATICAGASSTLTASGGTSYLWSNAATTAAITVTPGTTTTYIVTVTNAATCTATANAIVTVNALPTAAITPATSTICAGQSSTLTASGGTSYLWSNAATTAAITVTPAVTTTYTVTVTNAVTCTAIASRIVTVNASPVANAGTDQSIPNGTSTTLTGSASGGSGTYTWSWSPAGQLVSATVQNPSTVNLSTTTTYTLTVTDGVTSCQGTDVVIVTVTGSPLSVTTSATPTAICLGNSTQLNALASGGSGIYTYSWTSVPAGFTSTVANPIVSPLVNTTYNVTVNDGSNNATGNVSVTVNAVPVAAITPASATICAGQSSTLTASGGTSYLWSNAATTAAITVTPAVTTTYTVTVTDVSTCTAVTNAVVTVNTLPVVVAGVDQAVCAGTSVTLTGSGATSYTWDNGVTDGTPFTPTATTTYTVTGTTGGCSNTDQVVVTVNEVPLASATSVNATCGMANGTATVIATGGTGIYTYLWDALAAGQVTSTSTNLGVGSYSVTVSDGNCISVTSVSVSENGAPIVVLSATNSTICEGQTITLSATGADTYLWTPSTYLTVTTGSSVDATPLASITYTVQGTTGGCSSFQTIDITVNPLPVAGFSLLDNGLGNVTFTDLSQNATSWDWNFGDGSTANIQSPTYTYTVNGSYVITQTVQNACGSDVTTQPINMIVDNINFVTLSSLLEVYPNPSNGQFNIKYSSDNFSSFVVSIINVTGEIVSSQEYTKNSTSTIVSVDMAKFAKGIYQIKVISSNEVLNTRIVIGTR